MVLDPHKNTLEQQKFRGDSPDDVSIAVNTEGQSISLDPSAVSVAILVALQDISSQLGCILQHFEHITDDTFTGD